LKLSVRIRKATLDDVKGIVDVHCSDIEKWFKIVNGKNVEAKYEELSIAERWAHGGPWMSIETCSILLNNILTHNQYSLVACYNGMIVGELELYIAEENSILGKTAYIDVLVVHRRFRGKGIGKLLIKEAIKIAEENNCDTLSVWPTRETIEFYRKCGIENVAFKLINISVSLDSANILNNDISVLEFPKEYETIKDLALITPRIYSSYAAWTKVSWDYALNNKIFRIKGFVKDLGIAFALEKMWPEKTPRLYMWSLNLNNISQILKHVFNIARLKGIRELRVILEKELWKKQALNYPYEKLSSELVLIKKL